MTAFIHLFVFWFCFVRVYTARVSFDMDSAGAGSIVEQNHHSLFALNELLDIFCPKWTRIVYELSIAMLLLMYGGDCL